MKRKKSWEYLKFNEFFTLKVKKKQNYNKKQTWLDNCSSEVALRYKSLFYFLKSLCAELVVMTLHFSLMHFVNLKSTLHNRLHWNNPGCDVLSMLRGINVIKLTNWLKNEKKSLFVKFKFFSVYPLMSLIVMQDTSKGFMFFGGLIVEIFWNSGYTSSLKIYGDLKVIGTSVA